MRGQKGYPRGKGSFRRRRKAHPKHPLTPRAMVKKFFDKKCGVWVGPGFLILGKKFSGADSGEDSGEDSEGRFRER